MLGRLAQVSRRFLPERATSFVRKLLPSRLKVWIGGQMISQVSSDGIVTSRDGRRFVHIQDPLFFRVLFEGIYEPDLTEVFRQFVSPGDVILDVGGNFGWYATLFGQGATEGTVVSYEPVPDTFEALQENVRLNGLESVIRPFRLCVGREEGSVQFIRTSNSGVAHVAVADEDSQNGTIEIPLLTLDNHAAEWCGRISLVKIHVEGYELEVLRGSEKLLTAEVQPLVQVKLTDDRMARYGVSRNDIVAFLADRGFDIYELGSGGSVTPTMAPATHEIFGVGQGPFADRFRQQFDAS